MRISLACRYPGHEISLTAGGHRNEEETVEAELVEQNLIPLQFRQSSYESEHGCVWLSACLLMNTVDSNVATLMIESYQANESKYEWMDIFYRKKKGIHNTLCRNNCVLSREINTICARYRCLKITQAQMSYN